MDNFDLKQFLVENKLTENSRLGEIKAVPGNTGIKNALDFLKTKDIKNSIKNILESIIDEGLNDKKLFNFNKSKK